jgi:hypothetical protein
MSGMMCHTAAVRRTSSMMVMAAVLVLSASACKRNKTVVPEDDTWTPDESYEPDAGSIDTAPGLSEEEKQEKAKELYIEAEGKAAEGDWAAAVDLYEQAYYLVPGKHGFALKVGFAAEKVGDCEKAVSYLEHFVQYAEGDKYKDDIAKAKRSLASLKKKC